MGTRGFKAHRFRGRFYIFYNHWDSYPQGLGNDIVSEIPTNPDEYRKWLDALRAQMIQWEKMLLETVLTIPLDLIGQLAISRGATEPLEPRYEVFLDDRLSATPSFRLPTNDMWIEWVYVVDLDNELFIVDNQAHFKLSEVGKIP